MILYRFFVICHLVTFSVDREIHLDGQDIIGYAASSIDVNRVHGSAKYTEL